MSSTISLILGQDDWSRIKKWLEPKDGLDALWYTPEFPAEAADYALARRLHRELGESWPTIVAREFDRADAQWSQPAANLNALTRFLIFAPIENHFPFWDTARRDVEQLVPERLRFIENYPAQGDVGIDWRWAQQIMNAAPRLEKDDAAKMVHAMLEAVGSCIPHERLSGFLRRDVSPALLRDLNQLLAELDNEAVEAGEASLMDVVNHYLGIREGINVSSEVWPAKWGLESVS